MSVEHKAGFSVAEFSDGAGVSRSTTYELLTAGKIQSVKLGAKRIITTAPRDFLASLRAEAEMQAGSETHAANEAARNGSVYPTGSVSRLEPEAAD